MPVNFSFPLPLAIRHIATNTQFHATLYVAGWGKYPEAGRGVLPYKRLMGMYCWMGSHFHDWIDYTGVESHVQYSY